MDKTYSANGLVATLDLTLFQGPVGADGAFYGAEERPRRVVWGWGLGFLSASRSGRPPLIRFFNGKSPRAMGGA